MISHLKRLVGQLFVSKFYFVKLSIKTKKVMHTKSTENTKKAVQEPRHIPEVQRKKMMEKISPVR